MADHLTQLKGLLRKPDPLNQNDVAPAPSSKRQTRGGFPGWVVRCLRLLTNLVSGVADPPSIGLSSTSPAGEDVPAGGGESSFVVPIPSTFVEMNALTLEISDINPGPGISAFDVALYDTEANRDAGTYDVNDPGLQFLAPNIIEATDGPVVYRAAVLGLMQGSLDSQQAYLWGRIRNNDVGSTFDGTIAVEAYGRAGQRAV